MRVLDLSTTKFMLDHANGGAYEAIARKIVPELIEALEAKIEECAKLQLQCNQLRKHLLERSLKV
jgi:hypothetical protein